MSRSRKALMQLRSNKLLGRVFHAIKRSSSALVTCESEPVSLDDDNDSFLEPRGNTSLTIRKATRTHCPAAEPLPTRSTVSLDLFDNSSGIEIQSFDDLALGKRLNVAHSLLLLREDPGCLIMAAGCAELEHPYPTWTPSGIRSLRKMFPEVMGYVCGFVTSVTSYNCIGGAAILEE